MQHLSYTSRSSIFRFGIGMLMLFFFCAPVHANYIPFQSTSNRPVISQPISNSLNGSSNSNIVGEYKPYHPNVYVPFGDETPSSGNPLNNNGSGGSGDPNDDVGIPGWADTPSEPLPIGDTAPLFLFAAAMIAIIWIRQRRKQLQTTTQTSNTTNNDSSMHNTRHTSSNRLQKFFLLLAFVCFVGQVSGQTYYKREIYLKSQNNSNLPTNFPYSNESGSNGKYIGAYQSAYINGIFYVYDKNTPGLLKITQSNVSLVNNSDYNTTSYKDRPGTCRDDAGNLIINPCYSKLYLFTGDNLDKKTIVNYTHSNLENACNYINASGDVINGTGYVYFFPNGTTTVYIVKIVKGAINGSIITKTGMKVTGASASYVIPIDNNPNKFIYQTRNKNYYLYDNGNHTELTNTSSNTVGGIVFTLGGEQMFIRTAHDTYKGGWNMRKMSAIGTNVQTQEALGSSGYDRNQSVGAFFNYERVNDYTVKLYEYCQGHGIAAWKIGTSVSKKFRIQTYDGDSWEQNANGGTVSISYNDGSTGSVTGTSNVTLSLDEGCTANLTATAKSGYTFVGWYINGTSGIGSQDSTTTTYIPTRSNFEYVTARFAQMKNQTVNIHTYDATQNKYVANVAGGSVSVRYNNLGRGETTATLSSTSGTYTSLINSTVTLTATPKSGYVFIGWYKGNEHMDWATTNECSFKADDAYNITARFTKLVTQTFKVQTYESTAYTDGGNGGTMTVSYNDGTTANVTNSTSISNLYQGYNVTLTANSQTGYKFMGWFNNDFTTEYSKGSNTYTYRGEGTRTIYARFRKTYNQTVNISTYNPATGQYVSGGDGGIVTSVTYDDGNAQSLADVTNSTFTPLVNTTVTVVANAKPGYNFDGWYSGETLLSEDAEYTYTVNANKTITARFGSSNITLSVAVLNYNPEYDKFEEYGYEYNTITLKENSTVLKESYSSFKHKFENATTVTLTATPEEGEEGYDFVGWYINNEQLVAGTNDLYSLTAANPTELTLNLSGAVAVNAHFAPKKCWEVIIRNNIGGLFTVQYSRDANFTAYKTAESALDHWTYTYFAFGTTYVKVSPQPIHGYKLLGFKVGGVYSQPEKNNIVTYAPKYNEGDSKKSQVMTNFVREDEQIVYLNLKGSDGNIPTEWTTNDLDQYAYYAFVDNSFYTAKNNLQLKWIKMTHVQDDCYTCTIPGNMYNRISFVQIGKDSEGYFVTKKKGDLTRDRVIINFDTIQHLGLNYVRDTLKLENRRTSLTTIPATRYNCFRIKGVYSSDTGNGQPGYVDGWVAPPTQEGDYRLIYIEQKVASKTKIDTTYIFEDGDRIKKITSDTKLDTVSLHIYNKVSKDNNGNLTGTALNNPEIILQQWDGTTWVDIERHMVFGPLQTDNTSNIRMPGRKNTVQLVVDKGIDNIKAEKADASKDYGCGVWNFVIEQDGHSARLLIDLTHRYTGDYYIRTPNADGQYHNFTHPGNIMSYSEYAKNNHDYSHYFIRDVDINEDGTPTAEAGKHPVVKFCIANDYAINLCEEFTNTQNRFEPEEDIYVLNAGDLPADATVRFGWDIKTNRLTRAYIASTFQKNNEYLVVEGSNIGSPSGEATYFNDNSNWLYSIDLNATKNATAKVKAKMNGQYQYFMGAQPGSQNEYETLISGNGASTYPIRLLYDFKDDRFTTIYRPKNASLNGTVNLETPVMIEREHNNAPTQIKFENNASIKNVASGTFDQPAYAVMTFLESVLADASKTHHEKMFYWISFPFDVKISDVFGLGEYGKYWIMEEYDGAQRAQSGLAKSNWKYITKKSAVLSKNVGYVLCLNYSQILQDQLFKSYGSQDENLTGGKLSLYFPSKEAIDPAEIKAQTASVSLAQYENNATAWNHHNWHIIGVPSFADPEFTDIQQDAPFVYQYWHPGDAYAAVSINDVTFHAMHAYMVQYHGNINWSSIVNTTGSVTPKAIAAKTDEEADEKIMLRLELQQAGSTIDKTYVQLRNDKGTKGFDMSLDLTKIINAGANIYSIVNNHEMAGNAIPKEETVLPLGVVITAAGEYTFAMPQGTEGMVVELIDYEQGTCTNLLVGDYTVNMPVGTNNTRFALRLVPDKVATSVEDITSGNNDDNVRKLLIDGVLYLVKDGAVYDAQGHAIR